MTSHRTATVGNCKPVDKPTGCAPLSAQVSRPVAVRILPGYVPYAEAVDLQEDLVLQRMSDRIPDTLLVLEHAPVITLGVSAAENHLLRSKDQLSALGVEVIRSARGGDVTYHGPGQLVMYPVLKLASDERDVRGYVRRLEQTAILTAATFGVEAWRRPGKTGAWTQAGKIAAIGVRVRRWVTFHGMSFNVAPDPDGFRWIVPCGLAGEPVTSLRAVLASASAPTLAAVRAACLRAFAVVFDRRLVDFNEDLAKPCFARGACRFQGSGVGTVCPET